MQCWQRSVAKSISPAGPSILMSPPMPIAPYVWTVRKALDGGMEMTGHVPSEDLQRDLLARAGIGGDNKTEIGVGAPEDFAMKSVAAIDALNSLENGVAGFDGENWFLRGRSGDREMDGAATLRVASADPADWQISVIVPPPPPPVVEKPEIDMATLDFEMPEPAAVPQVSPEKVLAGAEPKPEGGNPAELGTPSDVEGSGSAEDEGEPRSPMSRLRSRQFRSPKLCPNTGLPSQRTRGRLSC